MEKLLTLHEVAEILRASPTTLRIWASKRKIPVIKVGRMVRVSPRELENWLRERTLRGSDSKRPARPKRPKANSDFDEFIKGLRQGE